MTFWRLVLNLKVFKGPRKPTAEKSITEKPTQKTSDFCHGEYLLWESTVFKAPTKWLLKGLYLYPSFDFPPSDLMRPRYCRPAHARMRMQNALLL